MKENMEHDDDTELSDAIKAQASRHTAPAELRDQIVLALNPAAPRFDLPRKKSTHATWQLWLGLGGAFACGVVLSLALAGSRAIPSEEDRISREVISSHVRSLMAAHLSDVASSDQHTVKPWFSGKLDFSPPVRDLSSEGFPLVGGRLDYLDQRSVAALVYRRQQHTINLFVWPSPGNSRSEPKLLSWQGFNITSWNDSGMQFWAVSDLGRGELHAFAQLLLKQDAK